MKKILGISLLSVLLLGCGNSEEVTETPESKSQDSTSTEGIVTVKFEFEVDDQIYDIDEDALEETVELQSETTLQDAMENQYEVIDNEGFITSIAGYEQDVEANAYWLYEINGEMAQIGAAEYVLEDGDEITWNLKPSE